MKKLLLSGLALAFLLGGCASRQERIFGENEVSSYRVQAVSYCGGCDPKCIQQAYDELCAKIEAQNARLGVVKEETVGE